MLLTVLGALGFRRMRGRPSAGAGGVPLAKQSMAHDENKNEYERMMLSRAHIIEQVG